MASNHRFTQREGVPALSFGLDPVADERVIPHAAASRWKPWLTAHWANNRVSSKHRRIARMLTGLAVRRIPSGARASRIGLAVHVAIFSSVTEDIRCSISSAVNSYRPPVGS